MTRIDKALNMIEPDRNELKRVKKKWERWQGLTKHWAWLNRIETDWKGLRRIEKDDKDWQSIEHDWTGSKRIEKG